MFLRQTDLIKTKQTQKNQTHHSYPKQPLLPRRLPKSVRHFFVSKAKVLPTQRGTFHLKKEEKEEKEEKKEKEEKEEKEKEQKEEKDEKKEKGKGRMRRRRRWRRRRRKEREG